MSDRRVHLMHTTIGDGPPLCGADDPGPVDWTTPVKVMPCQACMEVGPNGLPYELTMAAHLAKVREALRQKLRGLSEADRAAYKEQIVAIAASGLADQPAAPALYDEGQLLAALYAIAGIRAGFHHMKRAGVRPTFTMLEQALKEHEMITVALVEGTPL